MSADLVFLDTETLGLHLEAPVWEFAAVRRSAEDGSETKLHLTVEHDNAFLWLEDMPDAFLSDYRARYDPTTAWSPRAATAAIHAITRGAHVVGAVPSFDTERLTRLLTLNGVEPQWHYHLIDIENLIVGFWIGARAAVAMGADDKRSLLPPWSSDDLSRMVGVDPEQFERHTAMGDVRWIIAQWDAVTSRGVELARGAGTAGPPAKVHEITMYQARCTDCGKVEDDYGDATAWSDPRTPVEMVTIDAGWLDDGDQLLCAGCLTSDPGEVALP